MGRSVLSFITMLVTERRLVVERSLETSQSGDAAGAVRNT